jgi:sec-independent protein translocase protein TatC
VTNAIGHDPEDEIEASRAPLMDHLIELRMRLIICVAALFVGFGVCFAFADQIFLFLVNPFTVAQKLLAAQQAGGHHGPFDLLLALLGLKDIPATDTKALGLVYTAALEFFFTKLKLAGFGAVVLTFPVLAWQLYRFVAPGLYKNERYAFLPFLIASPFMFLLGAALVYYVMLPFVLWFSLSQQISTAGISIQLLPKVSDYLTLVTTLLLAFGLCFQLPVVVSLLGMAGHRLQQAAARRPPLRHRRRVHRRRHPDPARPDQPDDLGDPDVPALRDLDLVRVADRAPQGQGRARSRHGRRDGLDPSFSPCGRRCRRSRRMRGLSKANAATGLSACRGVSVFRPLTRPRFAGPPSPARGEGRVICLGVAGGSRRCRACSWALAERTAPPTQARKSARLPELLAALQTVSAASLISVWIWSADLPFSDTRTTVTASRRAAAGLALRAWRWRSAGAWRRRSWRRSRTRSRRRPCGRCRR